MTKHDIIDWLVNDDLDAINTMLNDRDFTYLDNLLRCGFKGYENMKKKELTDEMFERLNG